MAHPADIEAAWQAITTSHADHLSEPMRCIASVLEAAGLKISVVEGVLYADDVTVDQSSGIADCTASFRVEQEA